MTQPATRRPPIPLKMHIAKLTPEQRVLSLSLRREARRPTISLRAYGWSVVGALMCGFVLGRTF